ncbi:MAG TPA: TetR/AcrR family transcriptional regulator C-terminal domain-containing protein [Acidimicrobiales bacterium]|nr:TetR/AcrR family transcriptional regulator C-terminal domain-containing protein [Acidimicrobiales bacterium]
MPRPPTFGADDLASAGLDVVRREGWGAVSVRSVAAAAGVSPMATYRLASDADALRRLVADAAAAGLVPVDTGELFGTLAAWAPSAHDALARLPGLSSYVLTTWTELPRWLDIVEALLAAAEHDGLEGPPAVEAVNAVFAYVLARAGLHHAAAAAGPRRLAPLRARPDRYPLVRAHRAELTVARTRHHFSVGLDALLTGLRQRE